MDRHGLRPRDDKGGVDAMCLSLRGGSGARDAAIHRVSEDVGGVVCSVTEGQWIATGFALAMTRVKSVKVHANYSPLSLRGGNASD